MSQRIGAGDPPGAALTLQQNQYDILGRVVLATNALGGVTTNLHLANGAGGRREVTVNPDGGAVTNDYLLDGRLQSVAGTAAMPAQYEYGVEQDDANGAWAAYTLEIKLAADGGTNEWTKSYQDGAGRTYKTFYAADSAPYPQRQSLYNSYGQVAQEVDPDGVTTFYLYNAQGDREYTVVDMNSNGQPDLDGPDRVTHTISDAITVVAWGSLAAWRTRVWQRDDNDNEVLVSEQWASADGTRSASIAFGLTNQTQTVYAANGYRYVTNTAGDGSYAVATYQYGLVRAVAWSDSNSSPLSSVNYGYDSQDRQNTATDTRNGTTSTTFNNADLPLTVTTPSPDGVQPGLTTTFYYDSSLRTTNTVQPDQASVLASFYPNGLPAQSWGARTYPAGYGYTTQGRMQTMTNWSAFPSGGARVTTWNYDPYRGWLAGQDLRRQHARPELRVHACRSSPGPHVGAGCQHHLQPQPRRGPGRGQLFGFDSERDVWP